MRTVLITGGSRGIGAAMVRRFEKAGDRVFFTYLHAGTEAARLCDETGAEAFQADAAESGRMEQVVREAEQKAGSIDILICNAGISLHRMVADTTDEEFRRVMDVNLFGTFAAVRAVLPGMFWRRKGCILTVSSVWGLHGASCEAAYSASKAAVIGFTQAAAQETAGTGIRINCIAPGLIDTEMNGNLSGADREELLEEIPLNRMGTPEEVAETAFFLTGDSAGYINGQVISVNGGWKI